MKHRGEPVFKYQITVMESERGWGQNYWTEEYDTREEAQNRIEFINGFNTATRAPDYYMRAFPEIKEVQL